MPFDTRPGRLAAGRPNADAYSRTSAETLSCCSGCAVSDCLARTGASRGWLAAPTVTASNCAADSNQGIANAGKIVNDKRYGQVSLAESWRYQVAA